MNGDPLVVVGDCLLDVDIDGSCERLCPDAPAAPVVDYQASRQRPGGAGLAALLAARAGREVVLITGVASDEAGRALAGLLTERLTLVSFPVPGGTSCKVRVRVAGQTLLRLDLGGDRAVDAPVDGPVGQRAVRALRSAGSVLVSDYGRGITGNPGIRRMLAELARCPVVWDPHPKGGTPVSGTRLATPNEKEAAHFAGTGGGMAMPREPAGVFQARFGGTGMRAAALRAAHLVRAWGVGGVAVTLGARGALLSTGEEAPFLATAPRVPARDPCGAGDCLAVSATAALHDGGTLSDAVVAGVRAATEFVASGGAAAVAVDAPLTGPALQAVVG